MTPRGRFNLVMGVLVLAAVGFGFWRWRQQADSAAALSARIAAQTAQAQRAFEARTDAARDARALPFQTSTPLPPWGEPLGANLPAVLKRADAGEATAACRIGVELSLCNAPPTASGRDYCEGVDATLRPKAAFYLRKAALAGNRDAMLRYAAGPFPPTPDDGAEQNRYLQDPAFADWYRDALSMLQRALQAGEPRAVVMLANVYGDDRGVLDALVPDDPALAYRYRLLLSYLRGVPAPNPGALDVRERVAAEHQAQKLFREAFASRRASAPIPDDLTLQPDHPAAAPCQ